MLSKKPTRFINKWTLLLLAVAVALAIGSQLALAQDEPDAEEPLTPPAGSPLHPDFPLLDADGENVLRSGAPVSTMTTCGSCHDSAFIEQHSFHADAGLANYSETDAVGLLPWDSSPGLFGKWNPITYRYLSPTGDERIDLTTPEWLMVFGPRHVGGGPATTSRDGRSLLTLTPDAANPETSVIDPETGERVAWDWQESGVVEMNCFLCHTPAPNNDARTAALRSGDFAWANAATLLGSGIIEQVEGTWQWNAAVFNEDDTVSQSFIAIQDPTSENCAQCHGLVHVDARTPLALEGCSPEQWSTITTGQIISPQRLANSGMNLEDKADLSRSWDIHTERVIDCTDCHHSLNNPIYYEETSSTRPDHLLFDPRRIDFGEYLERPVHQFAKGDSAQGTIAPGLNNSLRRCESCHSIENTHDWLPYKEQHTTSLSCETCHIPEMYAPARQTMDWTVLQLDGTPNAICRGVEGEGDSFTNMLVTGFEPVLLPRQDGDGGASLAPHNLVSSWYWVYGDEADPRPAPYRDLQAAWLDGDAYAADVLAAFDADGSGALEESELIINTEAKETVIAERLAALGLENPQIMGEVRPYTISHNVTHGSWVTRDCQSCHSEESRITAAMQLADQTPGGVTPQLVHTDAVAMTGALVTDADGGLYYQPDTSADSLYVLGYDSVSWVDWVGILAFLGTFAGISVHGGLRYLAIRRNPPAETTLKKVYMYTVYERLWHWLQTLVILLLIFTGLIIHKPAMFGMFSFSYVVQAHNVLAAILVINAALAAFYHLASGEIRQFLPQPRGFFNQAFTQAAFYLRGIFRNEPHPFEKTEERKMNPLQQVTYLGILNVLLPLQVITGALMWGVQRWPELAGRLGGLPFLAPFHTLIAWLFATFIVMHVYLTTTGPTPMAGIKAMMLGWDDVEVHDHPQPQEVTTRS